MDKFVCVPIVQANRLDLSLFQFDYDLTFGVFFLNADRTVYGRYGSRSSHDEAESDISLEGFREAMRGALMLHAAYPANKESLAGKQPKKIAQDTPDDFPSLRGKFGLSLDYSGKVAKSCLHCHQIRDAERLAFRNSGKAMSDKLLLPYPMPDTIGLSMDPKARATVASVAKGSIAESAGLRKGQVIVKLNGQPILSTADMQWVLHHSEDVDKLTVTVRGENGLKDHKLDLPAGWRRATSIDWRVSSWDLGRMATGGVRLESLTSAERREAGIAAGTLALRARHVGQYNAHAAAKRAGFRKGDIFIQVGDFKTDMSEAELFANILQQKPKGSKIPTVVLRDGKRVKLMLPTQ